MDPVLFPNDDAFLLVPEEPHDIFLNYRKRPYHESLFRDIVKFLLKNSIIKGNIIDLGAWIGDNSAPWAKVREGIVYAIDPSDKNCKYINEVARLNGLKNLIVIKSAISDKDEIVSTNDNIGHASFHQDLSGHVKVTSTSLDNLYLNNTIKNIDFIHLDVEGMELLVLKGARGLISKERPIIVYEIHLQLLVESNNEIKNLLKEWNYNIYLMNEVLPGCRTDCRNILSVPIEKDDDIINKLNNYLNTFNYIICLHVNDRFEVLKFTDASKAYHTFMLLNGGDYACILMKVDDFKILKSYGIQSYVDACVNHCKSIKKRNDYFIQL